MIKSRTSYLYSPRLDGTSESSINEHRELTDIFARGDFSASDEASGRSLGQGSTADFGGLPSLCRQAKGAGQSVSSGAR